MNFLWVGIVGAVITFGALAAQKTAVSQQGRAFSPAEVTIARGDTVEVLNDDRTTHHVYVESPTFNFDSGERKPGESVAMTFYLPGTFDALCAIHPKMRLRIVVN